MNDKELDEMINKALHEEQELPEGLSERLELFVDALAEDEEKKQVHKTFVRQTIYWIGGIAAAFLLGIALFTPAVSEDRPMVADTFNDPEEAAVAAQQALVFLSTQLNKGLDPLADAGKEVKKVNEIISKTFNE